MKYILKENGGIPTSLLWILAISAGISVANLYYNQPLLGMIRAELNVSEGQANLIAMISQIGYALGLLFIIPMGDLFQRRRIVTTSFSLLVVSLLVIAMAPTLPLILIASFITGACAVMPQIFIPIAATYSQPSRKGQNVGIVLSGLLTGILASRVISGIVGEYWGWRTMYYIAAALMFIATITIHQILPDMRPTFTGKYSDLLKSLFSLVKQYPSLRLRATRSALAFGSFLALWSCLAFKMQQAPFHAGSNVVGLLGICGIAGALIASTLGRYIKRFGVERFTLAGCLLLFAAWHLFHWHGDTYTGLIAGIILIDIGMQCIQLSNQTSVMELCPSASNRINTIFMTTYFIGGSLGTFLAGIAWESWQWNGIILVGTTLTSGTLLLTIIPSLFKNKQ